MNSQKGNVSLRVSTVIPTFNRRELVVRAIESALAQTYDDQEIIVVDDGSTDGTSGFLRDRFGPLVRVIEQSNNGVSSARNNGVRHATGDLIAFLDSDDEWDASKLAKQVAFLVSHPDFSMVLTDVRRVDGKGNLVDVFRRRDVMPEDGECFLDVLYNPSLVPASVLIRKQAFEAVGGFDEGLSTAEDIEFHLRIAASYKIGVIEEDLTIAVRGIDGLSSLETSDRDYVFVVERVLRDERARIPKYVEDRVLFRTYLRNARSSFLSHRLLDGIRFLARAGFRARSLKEIRESFRILGLGMRASAVKAIKGCKELATGAGSTKYK